MKEHATQSTEDSTARKRKYHLDNLHLNKFVNFADKYEMPMMMSCDIIPEKLVPFNVAMSSRNPSGCVHFFIDDYQFERLWLYPERYIHRLSMFDCCISPDFSQYLDMTFPQRMWNNYRGKLIGAYLQYSGISVIPNVTWSTPDSYDYCFEGIPANSTIAINSTGVARHGLSRFLWLKGYKEALSRLTPRRIIRYGNFIEGENEELSVYFYNERIETLRKNGR